MKFAIFIIFFSAIITFLTSIPSFAIFFIITFFFSIAFFMYLLGASFLAILILIVYVGAIAILFVFCIILFERTPVYSNYFYYRSVIFCFVILFTFYMVSDIFFSYFQIYPHLTNIKLTKLIWSNNFQNFYTNSAFDFTFLDSFASFFFITNQGLIYMIFIGFFLLFFTLGVTYIFYFTKK